jgi:hypothetical protein
MTIGSHWLRITFGVAANVVGLACVMWPVMPKSWHAQEFVGRLFGASQDPSMGIQFMFFWLLTVPLGGAIAGAGTRAASGDDAMAARAGFSVVVVGVYAVYCTAGNY